MRSPEDIIDDHVGSLVVVALDVASLQWHARNFVDAHGDDPLIPSGLVDAARAVVDFPVLLREHSIHEEAPHE